MTKVVLPLFFFKEIKLAIQHRNIPDAEIHEPKGAASAIQNTVYVANGSGSGNFQKVNQATLLGMSGSLPDGYTITSDGSGGFRGDAGSAFGSLYWSNSNNPPGTSGPTLQGYDVVSGSGSNSWLSGIMQEVRNVNGYYLQPNVSGVFKISAIVNVTNLNPPEDSSVTVNFRFTTNGSSLNTHTAVLTAQSPTPVSGSLVLTIFDNLTPTSLVGLAYQGPSSANININSSILMIEKVG